MKTATETEPSYTDPGALLQARVLKILKPCLDYWLDEQTLYLTLPNHNFGIAFDVGIFNGGVYLDDSPLYAKVGALGRSQGLEWGGDWTSFPDEPHFQLPFSGSLAEARVAVATDNWGRKWA